MTGQPARIRSHSPSPWATAQPRCSRRPRRRCAHASVGTRTSSEPGVVDAWPRRRAGSAPADRAVGDTRTTPGSSAYAPEPRPMASRGARVGGARQRRARRPSARPRARNRDERGAPTVARPLEQRQHRRAAARGPATSSPASSRAWARRRSTTHPRSERLLKSTRTRSPDRARSRARRCSS